MVEDIQFIIIDLFCGAGGTTTGFEQAMRGFSKVAKVVACINHDPVAIKSHWANHPEVEHYEEDITMLYGMLDHGVLLKSPTFMRLIRLVEIYRACYPNAKVIVWGSLECTHFSKAKGGGSRNADSRTLANHLHPYIVCLDPDYVQIENVVEFMAWGPLKVKTGKTPEGYPFSCLRISSDKKTKVVTVSPFMVPDSTKNGKDWIRWRQSVCALGYTDEWRELNSADFGALTSRNRLFGCFAKNGLPMAWPLPTHAKKPESTSIMGELKKWEPVKKVLDFEDEGESVFNRKKPLSTKTFQRLYMGCVKHIAGGKKAFITKWNSNNHRTGTNSGNSIDNPLPTITTQNRLGLASVNFMMQSNGGDPSAKVYSIEGPSRTITTSDNQSLATATFIYKGYGGKGDFSDKNSSIEHPAPSITTKPHESLVFISRYNGTNGGNHDNSKSIEEPIGALATKDSQAKVSAHFLHKYYGGDNDHNNQSVEHPAGTILPKDKHSLVSADLNRHYIVNPSWKGNSGSVEQPCHVIVVRQDKAPLYLITCVTGEMAVPIYDYDCYWAIELKKFMLLYNICDIKMRMLKVIELKQIQGFPIGYVLKGTQTDQKKFIGNAVHPYVPEQWILAMSKKLFPETWELSKAA